LLHRILGPLLNSAVAGLFLLGGPIINLIRKVKDGRTATGRVDPTIFVCYEHTTLYLSYGYGRDNYIISF
jgi:hypothetical protein